MQGCGPPPQKPKAGIPIWIFVVGGGLLLVVLLVCGTIGGGFAIGLVRGPPAQEPAATPVTPVNDRPVGSCVIRIPGKPDANVPLFESEADYDDWGKAAANDDTHGQQQAFRRSGFWVRPGTKCKRIGGGFLSAQVRVLEGPHEGKAGWLATEWK